jgi:NNP family nitrate/nitrite transporter-like MFS transporter
MRRYFSFPSPACAELRAREHRNQNLRTASLLSSFNPGQVLILTGILYLNFLARLIFAPLLPIIELEFDLAHAAAGALFFSVFTGYCLGLFGSNFLSSQISHRKTILLSVSGLGGVVMGMSLLKSLPGIHVGLLLLGFSAGLYLPSGIAVLTELVSQEHWGKALSIHEIAPNLALCTAPLFVEFLLRYLVWRQTLIVLGMLLIFAAVCFWLLGVKSTKKGNPPNLKAIRGLMAAPSFWILGAVFVLAIGWELGIYTMLPLFLVNELDYPRQYSNTLISISRVSGVVLLFFSGFLIDRFGQNKAMVFFLIVSGICTIALGAVHGSFVTPAMILIQAASLACLFPAILTVVSRATTSDVRALAVSLLALIGFLIGGGMVPPLIGYLADSISFSFGFCLIGALSLFMLPFLRFLRAGST